MIRPSFYHTYCVHKHNYRAWTQWLVWGVQYSNYSPIIRKNIWQFSLRSRVSIKNPFVCVCSKPNLFTPLNTCKQQKETHSQDNLDFVQNSFSSLFWCHKLLTPHQTAYLIYSANEIDWICSQNRANIVQCHGDVKRDGHMGFAWSSWHKRLPLFLIWSEGVTHVVCSQN